MRRPATRSKPAPTWAATAAIAQPRFPVWLIAVLLGLVTLALYWPAMGFGFINYDDPTFVTANAHVQCGLNWQGVKWAFGLTGGDYWHPLTWLSLMLDASLFGEGAGGFHFTNVALHAVNSVLLFLLLRMVTGALWRSAVVAALFAVHPLRVESVAWVAERKDVLSACFGLLSLMAYARYAQRRMQNAATPNPQPATRFTFHANSLYLLSLFFLACGLMSKAMLVTWPFVMLLLDYWPLGRMQNPAPINPQPATRNPQHVSRFTFHVSLLREKIPFFVLSGISCVLTYLTEGGKPEVSGFEAAPALLRLENAFVAYGRYLGKTFWPVNLAVPYTNPGHWSWLEVGGAVLVIVGVWLAAFRLGRRRPYLLVGWCWFWGTLIPVIGLTKGWGCFMADRFTYVPSIGVLMLTVWGLCELTRGWHYRALALSLAGGAMIVLCLALARQQIGYWKDGESLFRHTVAVTENNHIAYNNLAHAVLEKGQIDEAIGLYQEAIRLKPDDAGARCNLGVALGQKGRIDEAIRQFQEAVRLNPDHADAHANLGAALASKGQIDDAIRQFQEAIRLAPGGADAHHKLGAALIWKGQIDEAIRQLQEAIRLKPDHAEAHYNLGVALGNKGQTDEAIHQYQEASRLNPGNADAHYNLGLALASKGQTEEAIRRFEAALKVKPDYPEAHNHLGLALVRQGHTDEAIRQFQEALRLKPGYASARKNLDAVLASKAHSSPPTGPATNH